MAVTKEWKCMAHGYFEAATPDDMVARCPRGCDCVERVFLTPQSISTSGRSRMIDKNLDELAKRFGFTNMSNANGDSVIHNHAKDSQRALAKNDLAPIWKSMGEDRQAQAAELGKSEDVRDKIAGAVLAGGNIGDGMSPGQFTKPHISEGKGWGDADMLQGALAEGQKNQGQP